MEIMLEDFVWGSHNHPMRWERIALPKKEGGLGLCNLIDMAKKNTMNRVTEFLEKNSVWAQWMYKCYKKASVLSQIPGKVCLDLGK